MRQILGYVMCKELPAAVPNLVVRAYDGALPLGDGTSRSRNLSDLRALGRPIASVLTDTTGKFVFPIEDTEFSGNEPRPDLTIAVFAPEDVLDPNNPVPAPPEQRLLYISTRPRTDAGAEEVFYIRLLQAQLEKFQLTTGADQLARSIEGGWRLRDLVTSRLAKRNSDERKKSEARQKLAKERTKNLSAVPRELRNSKLLVIGKSALEKNRAKLQQSALEAGLNRMATADYRPTLHLQLKREELPDIGLELSNGKLRGKVNTAALLVKVRELNGGSVLMRRGDPNTVPPEVLEAKYLTQAGAATTKPARKPKRSRRSNAAANTRRK